MNEGWVIVYLIVGVMTMVVCVQILSDTSPPIVPTPSVSTIPTPPRNLVLVSKSSTTISVSWDVPESNGGSPLTMYVFDINSIQVEDTTSLNTRTYTFTNLSIDTFYSIRVAATNVIGTSDWSNTIDVTTYATPNAPTELKAGSPTQTTIPLTWTAPTQGAPFLDYNVLYHKDSDPDTIVQTGSTLTSYTITGLTNSTTYSIRVQALNEFGEGTISDPIEQKTASGKQVVPNAPTDLQVTGQTSSSISLSWTAPTTGLPFTDYKVLYHTGADPDTTVNTGSTDITYDLTGLDPNTTYSIRVRAVNSIGDGQLPAPVEGTTDQVAPNAPTDLQVTGQTSSSISLSWTAPTVGSPFTDYKVLYHTGEDPDTTVNTGSTDTTYDLTGLDPDTTYSIRVRAVNSIGDGTLSSAVEGTTDQVAPNAPTDLQVTGQTSSSISLSWTAPTVGSPFTDYKVLYHTGADPDTTVNTGSTDTTYDLIGLDPNTTYSIRVRAVNSIGDGTLSSAVEGTTDQVAPNAPTDLQVTGQTSSSISLSWTAPTVGSPFTDYKVLYHTGADPDTTVNTGSTDTTYDLTGLDPDTTYSIRVRAVNSIGDGTLSSAVEGTTTGGGGVTVAVWYDMANIAGQGDGTQIISLTDVSGNGFDSSCPNSSYALKQTISGYPVYQVTPSERNGSCVPSGWVDPGTTSFAVTFVCNVNNLNSYYGVAFFGAAYPPGYVDTQFEVYLCSQNNYTDGPNPPAPTSQCCFWMAPRVAFEWSLPITEVPDDATITTDTWHGVHFVYNQGTQTAYVYIDSVLIGSGSFAWPAANTAIGLVGQPVFGGAALTGSYAEMRIIGQYMDAGQVATDFARMQATFPLLFA